MRIRPEMPTDVSAIRTLTSIAFTGMPFASGTEPAIIDALRRAGALHLSLVAEDEAGLVGHVAFSPVRIDGEACGWFGLGPVSVRPSAQRKGVGSALIRKGLGLLRLEGAGGCVLLGDPAYYRRFGFRADPALSLHGVPPVYFQCLRLGGAEMSHGVVTFHEGFGTT